MEPRINDPSWRQSLEGWVITDCAVRDRDVLYVCARRDIPPGEASLRGEGEIPARIVNISLVRGADEIQTGHQEMTGMILPRLGISRDDFAPPHALIVSANQDGDVWPRGGGINGPMEQIDKGAYPFTTKVKTLGGKTFAVCALRRIYVRTGIGQWRLHTELPREGSAFSMGFNDVDAFSGSDMYAVGGHGDVWRFNGRQWKRMGFPSTVQLGTVTCAGDGKVYISGEGGSLWEGRESTWRNIYTGGSSVLWNDALWFEGTLWLASDHQFKTWNGKGLVDVEHDGKRVPIRGHMDAHDGLLIVASPTEVWAYDGRDWRVIVAPYS